MESEPKEVFTYTNFPLTQDAPKPIYEFWNKWKHFPKEVVVNPAHKVFWREFHVKGHSSQHSGALPNADIPGMTPVQYGVVIKYDPLLDLDQMVCQGVADS